MCGICGIVAAGGRLGVDEPLVRRMARCLAHRGPDAEGCVVLREPGADPSVTVGLGHRRLSIIDLSGGAQPMATPDESLWIVYNGECYNFRDLARSLAARGHVFRTHSDTEVLLHLYREYGPEMVEHIRGMFAFALWDRAARTLFLARDRLGQKPLYYWCDPAAGVFAFASEIKSLLEIPGLPRDVSPEAIHDYLTFYYVPHPHSIFKAVSKLPPAHTLLWRDGRTTTRRYWRPEYRPDESARPADLAEQVRETLTEATRIRLISDVPLGAFLSGGMDSSIVVALMSKLTNAPVKTFSIGFEERQYDESEFARMVARHCGTEHYEEIVRPSAVEILPKLVWHYDEPFADSSAVNCYYVSRHARRHVTVVLTGDAGDETFAGYPRYGALMASLWLDRLGGPLRALFSERLLAGLPASNEPKDLSNRLRRFALGLRLSLLDRYMQWTQIFSHADKLALYTPDFGAPLRGVQSSDFLRGYYDECPHGGFVHRTTYVDLMTYLPCDILAKVDIAAMANSIEPRSPFLDHKLVELAGTIPIGQKLRLTPRGFDHKRLLKRVFAPDLPAPVLHRRKMGFGVPITRWLRTDLRDFAWSVLTDPRTRARGYFDPGRVEAMLRDHTDDRADHGYRLWVLLILELWHRRFIDGEEVSLP